MKRRGASFSPTAPAEEVQSNLEYVAGVGAGSYNRQRLSTVLIGWPPRVSYGDRDYGTHQQVTHTELNMALARQTETTAGAVDERLGTTFFSTFDQQTRFPAAWRNEAGALVDSWDYTNGIFRQTQKDLSALYQIRIQGSVSVSGAGVTFRFVLKETDGAGLAIGVLSSTPPFDIGIVDSPHPYSWEMHLKDDGAVPPAAVAYGGGIELTSTQWAGIYFQRLDGGPNSDVTWEQLQVTIRSTHWSEPP